MYIYGYSYDRWLWLKQKLKYLFNFPCCIACRVVKEEVRFAASSITAYSIKQQILEIAILRIS